MNLINIGTLDCPKCETPSTVEEFTKINGNDIIFFNCCKICREKDKSIEYKTCNKCNETKLITEFYKDKNTRKKKCKDCYNGYVKKGQKYKEDALITNKELEYSSVAEYRRQYYKKYYQLKKKINV